MMRTHVTFQASFPQDAGPSEPAGRELAQHIASMLAEAGYAVGTPSVLENYAYEFSCDDARSTQRVTVALVGDGALEWLVFVEPRLNAARRLLAKVGVAPRQPSASPEVGKVCNALHQALRRDPRIQTIRWYTADEWDTNPEGQWASSPS